MKFRKQAAIVCKLNIEDVHWGRTNFPETSPAFVTYRKAAVFEAVPFSEQLPVFVLGLGCCVSC